MNALFTLAEDFVRFAWWQSTLVLIAALLAGRRYRTQPWRQHFLLSLGIFFAAATPVVSILCREFGWGLLSTADSPLETSLPDGAIPGRLFYLLGWCMAVGGMILGFVILWGITASRRLYSRAAPLSDPSLHQMVQENARRIGQRTSPILFTSELVRGPTIWCWGIHPALLFPPGMLEKSNPDIRNAVFLHELAHLQRFDHWIQFLTACCGCLLFWNPLYWITRRQSDLYADQSCDALALCHATITPAAFADTLLEMATNQKPAGAFLSLSRKEKIMERVNNILDFGQSQRGRPPRRGRCWSCLVTGLFAVTMLGLAVCQQAAIAAPQDWGGHTHLVVFAPVGDFQPRTPRALLNKLNSTLFKTKIRTGYFRTWPKNDRLVGGICTNDPIGLSQVIEKIPELEVLSTRKLTNRSFESHTKRTQQSLPRKNSKFAPATWSVPEYGYTHLTIFKPVGDFHPRTPIGLLNKLNATLFPAGVPTGYFRTWPEGDRLIGGFCTNDPDGLKEALDKIPEVEWISTEPLTEKSFAEYSERPQKSLPRKDSQFEPATWSVPKYGYTHLTIFKPVGDFHPRIPIQLLNTLNAVFPAGVRTGYFRTWPEGDRLIGGICTDNPDELKEVLDKIPEVEWVSTEPLTEKSFAEYSERPQKSLPRKDSQFEPATWSEPKGGHTHMTVFKPTGDFHPRTPIELLKKLNATLFPAGVRTGYFRTSPEKDQLVGTICTDDPDGLKDVIDKIPELALVKTEPLTAKSFKAHEKRVQESLGWTTPEGAYPYLAVFKPVGDFQPKTPRELLDQLHVTSWPAKVRTGYFRTWPEDGRLLGAICTDDADGMKDALSKNAKLELVRIDLLDAKSFEKHSDRKQESLP